MGMSDRQLPCNVLHPGYRTKCIRPRGHKVMGHQDIDGRPWNNEKLPTNADVLVSMFARAAEINRP